ncbi:urea ABC transporter permease subunit UrtB [Roseivivax sp. THAF30]|uniref:urea ABC transporter permease subunit UrtB n=1 Tax=Roseivivax sp. THAF30 TaxID=2587852 RepID=UPI001267B00C|nr:urea ABC transporter permease subunit UrtB [Roseivivax sp. THAF30]QFT62755.1 High-affinity branched-chain amino acid transport system permease protein LivH [Roseivivax sp. THAF30]
MIRSFVAALAGVLFLAVAAHKAEAQEPETGALQAILQDNADLVANASRQTVQEVLDVLVATDLPEVPDFLATWNARELYQRQSDGLFVYVEDPDADPLTLLDISTGELLGTATSREVDQLRPNRGVQGVIAATLVQFRLTSDDPEDRLTALASIESDPDESHLALLRDLVETEEDGRVRRRAEALLPALVIAFADTDEPRVEAIRSLAGNVSLSARATLNPLLSTQMRISEALPENENIARELRPGTDALSREDAYAMLVEDGLAPPLIPRGTRADTLAASIVDGAVGGVPVGTLNTEEARDRAYAALVEAGQADPAPTEEEIDAALDAHVFFEVYREDSAAVTDAARATLDGIETRVAFYRFLDLSLDGLSLASIYFLAAIGLAITFGVMGVINMAHGEFIMLGAYTGYVVQSVVANETLSIAIAIPLAFTMTFAAGVAMERLVIRWLYHRPLETLLATFGISIALQQIIRLIFGALTQPLSPPDWLAGSVSLNDVVSISSIRIAIFLLGAVFFVLLWLILNRTRLGLEVRAVTQNPKMAASMGINPDRINMLTFGLGSGIAGIAGVAIGLFAQVVPDLGQNYIVQSFMTVVVGGVGNIFGTLVGAFMIGSLQKAIEFMNPSNTLAAQTYMILFVILFIQFRPRGIIALRGRAAGD